MPPTSTDLDLFILALVQRGCATAYDLKARAGISIGSSAPVLQRLANARLLTRPNLVLAPAQIFRLLHWEKRGLRQDGRNCSLIDSQILMPFFVLHTLLGLWGDKMY